MQPMPITNSLAFLKSSPMPDEVPPESENGEGSQSLREQLKLPKIIHFDELARCGEEVWIECAGQLYRLRKTRQAKLILTK